MDNFFDTKLYLLDLKSRFNKINKDEYYLSYSGGKDSHFLYWFIKEYLQDDKIEIVGVNTFLEHPQIRERIIKNSDTVLYPSVKPFNVKDKYGIPCFTKKQDTHIQRYQNGLRSKSLMKFINRSEKSIYNLNKNASELTLNNKLHKVSSKCCDYFKKQPLKDYEKISSKKAILGVRAIESTQRKAQYKKCFQSNGNFTPIYDLSSELLDEIYREYDIEIPQIYKYISRTGCMGCPYGRNIELELSLIENENQRNFIIDYFKESYDVKKVNYKEIQCRLF